MDIKTIFKVFKYQAKECAKMQIILAFGGFLLGFLLVGVIVATDSSETYVPVGTLVAGIILIILSFFFIIKACMSDFTHTVKMGIGRKNYLAGTVLYYTAAFVVIPILLNLLMLFESKISGLIYKSAVIDSEFTLIQDFFGNIPLIAGIEFIVLLAGLCFGALILRFGLVGFWVAYGIFMVGSLSMAKFADILPILNKINPAFIMPALILIFLLFSAASVRIYLKKEL